MALITERGKYEMEKEALSASSPAAATSGRFLFNRKTATPQNFNCNLLDDPGEGKQPFSIIVEVAPSPIDLFRGEP